MKKIMKTIMAKAKSVAGNIQLKLAEEHGQIFMEHTVGFIAVIVLGGIAISLLTALLRNDMAPSLTSKIMSLFN